MKFDLIPHAMTVEPEGPAQHVAYVLLPGANNLKAAYWHNDCWLDHRGKPFPDAPACWYSVEPVGNE